MWSGQGIHGIVARVFSPFPPGIEIGLVSE